MPNPLNDTAKAFKALHVPGTPVVLANVYDAVSARTVASVRGCKALATASFAIAAAHDLKDDDLSLDLNVASSRLIAKVASQHSLPVTADLQSGYGSMLESAVQQMIDAGVVGCNLEDYDAEQQRLCDLEENCDRIRRALQAASDAGVPDLVINARCDVLVRGGELDEVLRRGKAYLAAGATTVFVWDGQRGVHDAEIKSMVQAFGGMLNAKMKVISPGYLTVAELSQLGVARISVGPELQQMMMGHLRSRANELFRQDGGVA